MQYAVVCNTDVYIKNKIVFNASNITETKTKFYHINNERLYIIYLTKGKTIFCHSAALVNCVHLFQ